ncbi:glycoside hydrolase family 127 protein [Caldicellulosiruptoraceae bacterium PP1]
MIILKNPEIKQVEITDLFWSKYVKLIRDVVVCYQWEVLNDFIDLPDKSHAVKNFKIAAGLEEGEFEGFVFQDSDLAKWIEGASYILERFPNKDLENKVDEIIDIIAKAQWEDGYLNTYFTLKEKGKRWTNLEECHELYVAGHMIEAGVAYFKATEKRKLLDVVCKLADHIDQIFGEEEGKLKGYDGHPEIELALVKLYEVTNNQRYLKLAKFFVEERGKEPYFFDIEWEKRGKKEHWQGFKRLGREYLQAHLPVREQKEAVGHAVRAVYLYSGMVGVAAHTDDMELLKVCKNLYEDIIKRKMYIIGAIGSSAYGEAFTFEYDLPNDLAYAETCASVGLIFLSNNLFKTSPSSLYYDTIEKALYNTIIGAISLDGKKYFYVNPLEVNPKECEKRADHHHVKPTRQPWFACACCPPNVIRLLASLGKYIYSYSNDTIFVNLYIGSSASLPISNSNIELELISSYPFGNEVKLRLKGANNCKFKLMLRIPSWSKDYSIYLNGTPVFAKINENGYIAIEREWNDADEVKLEIITEIKKIRSNPNVRENIGKIAVTKGPIVFCAEEVDNGKNLNQIFIDENASISLKFDKEILDGVFVVEMNGYKIDSEKWGDEPYKEEAYKLIPHKIKLIPYYAWANRGIGEMSVWLNTL